MREILFRGKTTKDKEWVYGDLLHDGYDYDVAIWEQNGKKIFEGDIVRHYNCSDMPESYSTGRIFWDEKHCKFRRTSNTYSEIVNISGDCVYEVIGNIHDNPELMEVDNERKDD
jgi:uncharacterized phage protein (TIGR01671 family)